jgi:hypothetical protein
MTQRGPWIRFTAKRYPDSRSPQSASATVSESRSEPSNPVEGIKRLLKGSIADWPRRRSLDLPSQAHQFIPHLGKGIPTRELELPPRQGCCPDVG